MTGTYILRQGHDASVKDLAISGPITAGGRTTAGDGISIVATDGGQQRAFLACADDGGTALGVG